MSNIRKIWADRLFLIFVVLPTILSVVYFGLIASDVYVSESRFVVRSPDKPSLTGLGILLKNAGFSNAGDEASAAIDYIQSRDALQAINIGRAFANAYGDRHVSIFNRYDPLGFDSSFEDLYRFFKSKVKISANSATGITVLTVKAFKAQDAQQFNERLLEMAEHTVNRLNGRARDDLIRFATAEVAEAERQTQRSSQALARYRDRRGLVDPERQAAIQIQMQSKLQDELITTRTQLAELRNTAPANQAIPVLETRIASLSRQAAEQMAKAAGGSGSLAAEASAYQRLVLGNDLAAKQLASALTSLDQARTEARRQQAYVERIAQPNLPDAAGEPHRLRGIFATLIMGLILWGVSRMLIASIREHID